MDDEKYQKLKDYAIKLLSYRPRSEKEIRGKIKLFSIKRRIQSQLVEKLMQNLISDKMINDQDFALWWIQQRELFKPKGIIALQAELRNKGIGPDILDKIFSEKKNGKYWELEQALVVVGKKLPNIGNLPWKQTRNKLAGILARRGFSWEIIYQVIDEINKKSYNR